MQKLVYSEILENAREAYKERRLQFQLMQDGKIPSTNHCEYKIPEYPDCGCAVGVSLMDETVEEIDTKLKANGLGTGIYKAYDKGIVQIDDEDYVKIVNIQRLHDQVCSSLWLESSNRKSFTISSAAAEREFKIFLGLDV